MQQSNPPSSPAVTSACVGHVPLLNCPYRRAITSSAALRISENNDELNLASRAVFGASSVSCHIHPATLSIRRNSPVIMSSPDNPLYLTRSEVDTGHGPVANKFINEQSPDAISSCRGGVVTRRHRSTSHRRIVVRSAGQVETRTDGFS